MIRFSSLLYPKRLYYSNHQIHIALCIVIPLVVKLFYYSYIAKTYASVNIKFSAADYVLFSGNSVLFFPDCVFFPTLLLVFECQNDFRVNSLIRYKKRLWLYIKHLVSLVFRQLIVTIVEIGTSVLLGYFLSRDLNNFVVRGSYFRFIHGGQGLSIPFINLCLYECLSCLLFSILILLVVLLVYWITNRPTITIFFLFVFSCIEMYKSNSLYDKLSYNHVNIFDYSLMNTLFIFVFIILLTIGGAIISLRKEFINAK